MVNSRSVGFNLDVLRLHHVIHHPFDVGKTFGDSGAFKLEPALKLVCLDAALKGYLAVLMLGTFFAAFTDSAGFAVNTTASGTCLILFLSTLAASAEKLPIEIIFSDTEKFVFHGRRIYHKPQKHESRPFLSGFHATSAELAFPATRAGRLAGTFGTRSNAIRP